MAGCSKKQYAIMMNSGPEGQKLASKMGKMEQPDFNEAFKELINSDAATDATARAENDKWSPEEDEDYQDFDVTSDEDYEDEDEPDEKPSRIKSLKDANDDIEKSEKEDADKIRDLLKEKGIDSPEVEKAVDEYWNKYGDYLREKNENYTIEQFKKELIASSGDDKNFDSEEPNPMDEFSGPDREGPSYAQLESEESLRNKLKELKDKQFALRREYNKTGNDDLVDQERALEDEMDDIRDKIMEHRDGSEEKPQRFSREPSYKDYITDDQLKELRDYEYYSRIDDFDKSIKSEQDWKQKTMQSPYHQQEDLDKIDRRINLLSNPDIQRYVNDRNAYNKQLDSDFNEYMPVAKQKIIEKLLGDNELYHNSVLNKEKDDIDETDDLYDDLANEFQNKYGYERKYNGELFSPIRRSSPFATVRDEEERIGPGQRRSRYNKEKYLAELLSAGEITLADLRKFLGK